MNKQTYLTTLARLCSTKADMEKILRKYPFLEVQTLTISQLIRAVHQEGF